MSLFQKPFTDAPYDKAIDLGSMISGKCQAINESSNGIFYILNTLQTCCATMTCLFLELQGARTRGIQQKE